MSPPRWVSCPKENPKPPPRFARPLRGRGQRGEDRGRVGRNMPIRTGSASPGSTFHRSMPPRVSPSYFFAVARLRRGVAATFRTRSAVGDECSTDEKKSGWSAAGFFAFFGRGNPARRIVLVSSSMAR